MKEKLQRDTSNFKKESYVGNNAFCSKNAAYKIKVAGKSRAQSQTFLIYTHIFIFSPSNLFKHSSTFLNIQHQQQKQLLPLCHHDRKRYPQYDEGQQNKRKPSWILFCKWKFLWYWVILRFLDLFAMNATWMFFQKLIHMLRFNLLLCLFFLEECL